MNTANESDAIIARVHRQTFKDSFYGIGDKMFTLADLAESRDDQDLKAIVDKLDAAHDELKAWADKQLKNWD